MLRYIYADEIGCYPRLARTMFRDRARQFHKRLKWEVTVDENGNEMDEYDRENPLYVIWELADGTHGGSMRFLPTTGPTMVNDHFRSLADGVEIKSPFIWECTRFCQSPDAPARVAECLMLGAMEAGRGACLSHIVGVFDARMVRIYRRLGWGPIIMGTEGQGRDAISVGLWSIDEETRQRLLLRAGISDEVSRHWHARSFGASPAQPVAMTA